MSEASFSRATGDLVLSVEEAFLRMERPLTAFILLYSAIDILSSLTRPVGVEKTSGPIFKAWVRKYMIADSNFTWNEGDVWGARCGILHTFTVQSDHSRAGQVRELHYVSNREFATCAQQEVDPVVAAKVVVCLPDFIRAFMGGVTRFIADVQSDAELRVRVFAHADKLIIHDEKRA